MADVVSVNDSLWSVGQASGGQLTGDTYVALNGEAQALITGDQDLLVLADEFLRSHKLNIISPTAYLGSDTSL